jgi:hypothetical protein
LTKQRRIKIAMVIPALLIALGIVTFMFPAIHTTLEQREYNIRYDNVQGHLNGVNALAVSGDILYVLTNLSDCLVALDLEGKPIYTIYFRPSEAGINKMLLLEDGSLVIDHTGEEGFQRFKGGILIDVIKREHPDYDKFMDMFLYEKPELATNEAIDKFGREYFVDSTGTGVDIIDEQGNYRNFIVEPYPYWLFSFPFPSLIYLFVGLFIWSRLKKNLQEITKEREFVKPDDFA